MFIRLAVILIAAGWVMPANGLAAGPDAHASDVSQASGVSVKTYFNIDFGVPGVQGDLHVPILPNDQVLSENNKAICPVQIAGSLRPGLIVVHGGGWVAGDKWTLSNRSHRFCELGICVLNINYRLAPRNRFPTQLDDVRTAMLYLNQHQGDLQLDMQRLGAFGYSAGGHLVVLAAVLADESTQTQLASSTWDEHDPRWKKLPELSAVCAGAPPTDFQHLPPDSEMFGFLFGGTRKQMPTLYHAASPLAHISKQDPAIEFVHGETDMLVPVASSERMVTSLTRLQIPSHLLTLTGKGHLMTLMSQELTDHALDFFQRTLRP